LQCYYHNWISIIQTGEKEPGSLCIDDWKTPWYR
jgi:hypothetical protein